MSATIAILGSCVTRDAFGCGRLMGMRPVLHVARTSFVSLVAAPVAISESDIPIEGKFERTQILFDFTKTGLAALRALRPDILIVDLIDERFGLLRRGDQVVTRSNYVVRAGLEASPLLAGFQQVKRNDPSTHAAWMDSAVTVLPTLHEIAARVVVHRALYALGKYMPDGSVSEFVGEEADTATRANRWMTSYYDRLLQLGVEGEICVPDELRVSDVANKWGRDFFHYGAAYYENLASQIADL